MAIPILAGAQYPQAKPVHPHAVEIVALAMRETPLHCPAKSVLRRKLVWRWKAALWRLLPKDGVSAWRSAYPELRIGRVNFRLAVVELAPSCRP